MHQNQANVPLKTFDCKKCYKKYFSYSGLYLHKKTCNADSINNNSSYQPVFATKIDVISEELMQKLVESNTKLLESNQILINEINEIKRNHEELKAQMVLNVLTDNGNGICPKRTKKKETNIPKQQIPLVLKRNVWNKHIGENIGKHLCLCCKLTDITQMNFSCGHIISEHNGGELKLNNLKPICVSCNSSMGTNNMDEFIQDCGL
jgi:5-methylcytosine-specific restriction endonuclease McrA